MGKVLVAKKVYPTEQEKLNIQNDNNDTISNYYVWLMQNNKKRSPMPSVLKDSKIYKRKGRCLN